MFKPYSGVKTSILILDRALARKTDSIAFFKVENDGFDLGDQRRPISDNDLPQVQVELSEYFSRLRSGEPLDDFQPKMGLVASKSKIAADGDYNLSGDRYRGSESTQSSWAYVYVGEVFERRKKAVIPSTITGPVDYVGLANISQNTGQIVGQTTTINPASIKSTKSVFESNQILFGKLRPNLNKVWLSDRSGICSTDIYVINSDDDRVEPTFYSFIFRSRRFNDLVMREVKGAQLPRIGWTSLARLQIPLPPLELQKGIVAEVEGYQKIIDGARAVVDNYRPQITIDPEWPMVARGDICAVGGEVTTEVDPSLPYLGADSIEPNTGRLLKTETLQSQGIRGPVYEFSGSRLMYSKIRPYLNKLAVVDLRGYCSSDMYPLMLIDNKVDSHYLAAYVLSESFNQSIRHHYERARIPKINRSQLFKTGIHLPSLDVQKTVVSQIEDEGILIDGNRELVCRFKQKIQDTIGRVWG